MKKEINILIYLFIHTAVIASDKVLIITHQFNRPDLIGIQHKTFQHFLKDEYEFVVFNDANNENMATQITNACICCNIRCIRVPQEIHTRPYLPREPRDPLHRPNIRHANCIQYSMDILGFDHNGIVVIIDSDMFLIRPLHITAYMQNKDIASLIKGSINNVIYLCPALSFFNMNTLPDKNSLNFNCGTANGASVDSGGWTYYYLKNHPNIKIEYLDSIWSYNLFCSHNIESRPVDNSTPREIKINTYRQLGFNDKEINFFLQQPDTFEIYFDKHFLHYRAATNYNNLSQNFHHLKLKIFNEFLDNILQN